MTLTPNWYKNNRYRKQTTVAFQKFAICPSAFWTLILSNCLHFHFSHSCLPWKQILSWLWYFTCMLYLYLLGFLILFAFGHTGNCGISDQMEALFLYFEKKFNSILHIACPSLPLLRFSHILHFNLHFLCLLYGWQFSKLGKEIATVDTGGYW